MNHGIYTVSGTLSVHLEWISRLQCPVGNLDSSAAPQVLAEEVIRAIA